MQRMRKMRGRPRENVIFEGRKTRGNETDGASYGKQRKITGDTEAQDSSHKTRQRNISLASKAKTSPQRLGVIVPLLWLIWGTKHLQSFVKFAFT